MRGGQQSSVGTYKLISAKYVGILRKTRKALSAVRPPPQIPGQTTFVHFPFIAVAVAGHLPLPLPLTLCVFFKPVSSPVLSSRSPSLYKQSLRSEEYEGDLLSSKSRVVLG